MKAVSLAQADHALDLLLTGRIGLHQVPGVLCSWWWAGVDAGEQASASNLRLLRAELVVARDRLADLERLAGALPPVPYFDPEPEASWPRPIRREAFA